MNQRQFPAVTAAAVGGVRPRLVQRRQRPAGAAATTPTSPGPFSLVDGPMPELWPQFGALARVPVLVVRGENSDILSAQTLEEMRARHPRLDAITVPGQGHAPLLKDAPTVSAIAEFLAQADAMPQRRSSAPRHVPPSRRPGVSDLAGICLPFAQRSILLTTCRESRIGRRNAHAHQGRPGFRHRAAVRRRRRRRPLDRRRLPDGHGAAAGHRRAAAHPRLVPDRHGRAAVDQGRVRRGPAR